jgi:hypothetical protein
MLWDKYWKSNKERLHPLNKAQRLQLVISSLNQAILMLGEEFDEQTRNNIKPCLKDSITLLTRL